MTGQGDPDELEISSHATLHNLLADLNTPAEPNQLPSIHTPSWTFPSLSPRPTSSTPPAEASTTAPLFPRRLSSRDYSRSVPELDLAATTTSSSQPSGSNFFNTPNRSIFSSGPPTSSVSANTAQASMSTPSAANPSLLLSSPTIPSSGTLRRSVHYQPDTPSSSSRRARNSRAEKNIDDPSSTAEDQTAGERRTTSTPTALSRLFTAPEATTPVVCRHASYVRTPSCTEYTRSTLSETAPLPNHLYNRGLLSGKHSDIAVHAFGVKYALHRLLLDRAPFFSSALSEPWTESSSKEIKLQPEDIDSNITQSAFELALKRIYGCNYAPEEDKEAVGLFATGCWLEMADLIDSSVVSLLKQMCPAKLSSLIRLVTNNYYGKPGDRILSSAKAMLCREGWEMPLRYWDGIPGDIIREIIAGDGFFVPGEWERWILAKRVLDRRLKVQAQEIGLVDYHGKAKRAPPDSMNFLAVRFDTVYRKNSAFGNRGVPEAYDPWLALYTCPDVAALLVLLDEGIHYVHLSFEQLQKIREQRDILGVPVMPEKVISNALWMSLELRQKIMNARELDMELGLSQISEERVEHNSPQGENNNADLGNDGNVSPIIAGKTGKQVQVSSDADEEDDMESGSWDGNGKPRKFWIPNTDATSVMGGNPEVTTAATNGTRPFMTRHVSRLSATIDAHDVQWASDFGSAAHDRPQTPSRGLTVEATPPVSYTHYPPFRFAAEFPNPRLLKEKKRIYSRTVWYAGSLWNVYVQKVETAKNTQLGVYLHRAKEKEGSEELMTGNYSSVDERTARLEREILTSRNERRSHRQQQREARTEAEEETSGSSGDPDATLVPTSSVDRPRATTLSGLLRGQGIMKASQTPGSLALSSLPDQKYGATTPDTDDDIDQIVQPLRKFKVSALPPYVDGRPTIKTYFKIYTPSKGGRILSEYESAPDKFNFSQSWGWRSSNMVLDDGILGYEEGARSKDGGLRFMVVIGNV